MDEQTLDLLEFSQVLSILEGLAQSTLGRQKVREMAPLTRLDDLQHQFACLQECRDYADREDRPHFAHLEDPGPSLHRLSVQGQRLEPAEFLVLLEQLKAARQLRSQLKEKESPLLAAMVQPLGGTGPLIRAIEKALDPSGAIRDGAHPELARARRRQTRGKARLQQHLDNYLSGTSSRFLIQDPFVTERNARWVIPVKAEHQRDLPGVVHAASSSGATVFVEPLSAVPLNNELLALENRERELVAQVLEELTQLLRSQLSELGLLAQTLGELDRLFACSEYGRRVQGVIPELGPAIQLRLRQARHPLLLESLGEGQAVPIDVTLEGETTVLVISGPNAGGKTAALKTVGLLAIMAHTGLPLPASEARFPLLAQVLADIGDHQSIAQQMSSFSSHILRVRTMIESLALPSLILMDEVGRGTDPLYEGALGSALIDFFRKAGALVVATTHHPTVKVFAAATPGALNSSVGLDDETLRPTYVLRHGVAGGSSGFEVAEQLGLPTEIVATGRGFLKKKDMQIESYLIRLRQELESLQNAQAEVRQQLENTRKREIKLEETFRTSERERARRLEHRIRRCNIEMRKELERFIGSVQDRLQTQDLRREARCRQMALEARLREELATPSEPDAVETAPKTLIGKLAPGDSAYYPLFRKSGVVVAVTDEKATLEMDGKRVQAPLERLQKIERPEKSPRKLPRNVILRVVEGGERELNLAGNSVEDALLKADKFLDRAVVAQLEEVQIIHGFGTGRLRAALTDFLEEHPQVDHHQVEGGRTVVALRQ